MLIVNFVGHSWKKERKEKGLVLFNAMIQSDTFQYD